MFCTQLEKEKPEWEESESRMMDSPSRKQIDMRKSENKAFTTAANDISDAPPSKLSVHTSNCRFCIRSLLKNDRSSPSSSLQLPAKNISPFTGFLSMK